MSGEFSDTFDGVKIAQLTIEEQGVLKGYLTARKNRARREDDLMDVVLASLLPDTPRDNEFLHKSALAESALAEAAEVEKKALAAWRRVRLSLHGDRLATAVETGMEKLAATFEGGVDSVRNLINDGPAGGFFDGLRSRRSDQPAGTKPEAPKA